MMKKKGYRTIISDFLVIALLVEAAFLCIGFSEWLAKLTLFSFINRMEMIYGWTATIFTCYCIYIMLTEDDFLQNWEKAIYPILYVMVYLAYIDETIKAYLPLAVLIGELIIFAVILYAMIYKKKKIVLYTIAGMMFLAGGTVNPISSGIAAITNHPIYDSISEIVASDPNANWMVFDADFTVSNYCMACGAKTINATNFLPDDMKWEIIDPDSKYQFETNRYLNQTAVLVKDDSEIRLLNQDYILIALNPKHLKELDTGYILTRIDYSELLMEYGISTNLLAEHDGYLIYQLTY